MYFCFGFRHNLGHVYIQIMECRRVLTWTYAYEYYLKEDEVAKLHLLKDTQGMYAY